MTDDIRARHERVAWSGTPDTCSTCGTEWPCDAIRLFQSAEAWRVAANIYRDRWRIANADADRLAEALRLVRLWTMSGHGKSPIATITAALAAHDAQKETAK